MEYYIILETPKDLEVKRKYVTLSISSVGKKYFVRKQQNPSRERSKKLEP